MLKFYHLRSILGVTLILETLILYFLCKWDVWLFYLEKAKLVHTCIWAQNLYANMWRCKQFVVIVVECSLDWLGTHQEVWVFLRLMEVKRWWDTHSPALSSHALLLCSASPSPWTKEAFFLYHTFPPSCSTLEPVEGRLSLLKPWDKPFLLETVDLGYCV